MNYLLHAIPPGSSWDINIDLDLAPASPWNGSPGSYYGGSIPTAWQDPVRSTAKPAMLPLSDNGGLCFGPEDLIVGVHAYDASGLVVEVNVEGTIVTVPRTKRVYVDARGVERSAFGHWIRLDHSAFTQDGGCFVIWRATSNDTTKQARVLTRTYYRKPAQFSHTRTVGPAGANHTTLAAARAYLRGLGSAAYQPRIQIIASGDYLWSADADYSGVEGYLVIETAPGVSASIRSTNTQFATANLRLDWAGTLFRNGGATSSLKFDIDYFTTVFNPLSTKRSPIFEGVEFFSTTGRDTTNPALSGRSLCNGMGTWNTSGPVFLECYVHDIITGFTAVTSTAHSGSALIRNCRVYNLATDAAQSCPNIYGLDVDTIDNSFYRTERSALSVVYSGPATTAQVQKTGSNGSNSGTFKLFEDGVEVASISLGAGKTVADLVSDINLLSTSGWSASALSAHAFWEARFLSFPGTTSWGPDAARRTAKTNPVSYITANDMHSDVTQVGTSGYAVENGAVVNVRASRVGMSQGLFLGDSIEYRDFFVINFARSSNGTDTLGSYISQITRASYNVHIWNCTFAEQNFVIRSGAATFDSFSSVRNNYFLSFAVESGVTLSGVIDGNHYQNTPIPFQDANPTNGGPVSVYLDLSSFEPTTAMPKRVSLADFDLFNEFRLGSTEIGAAV